MFMKTAQKHAANWFPGKAQARDRWGDNVGTQVRGREFNAANAIPGAAERMRWSLGHA